MSVTHTSSEQSSSPTLANRYGSPKRRLPARGRWIIAGAALLAGVVLMGIIALTASADVTSKDVGFELTDSTHATVDFRVTKDPEATAHCAVQVLNESYAIVGWNVVEIGPTPTSEGIDGGRTTVETIDLRTGSQGVSGGVDSCWIAD